MPESPPPRRGQPDRIVPGRIGLAPKKTVDDVVAAADRVSRMPWHPDYVPGHTSEELVVKMSATRASATPLQIGAGLVAGAAGLRALLRRYAPRPVPAAIPPVDGLKEEDVATKSAFNPGGLPDIPDDPFGMPNGIEAFAPEPQRPFTGPPRPPAVPRGPHPFQSPSPAYATSPGDFEPPAGGLLSRLQGFYDESVAPHVQGAADWANGHPLAAAGLLGLGGLGAYGAYRAMQPYEEDEEDGPVKMGGVLAARREAAERPGFFPANSPVNTDIPRG